MQHTPCLIRAARMRWAILTLLAIVVLMVGACGAPQPQVYRVGVLSGLPFAASLTDGFKTGMTELGYVEGQDIVYDVHVTTVDPQAYRQVLQGFVAADVDLILAFPTEAALEAKAVTTGTAIPVVFDFAFIEGLDLVKSVSAPGGNLTGVRHTGVELTLTRFAMIRELLPQATRVLVPYLAGYPNVGPQLDALRLVAAAAGVTLVELPVADTTELAAAMEARRAEDDPGVDAVVLLSEPLAVTPATYDILGSFAAHYTLPIGGALLSPDGNAALFNLNVEPAGAGRQAAPLADKILKGAAAGTIPVVSSEGFLQINYRAAQRLGIALPEGWLSQAHHIIR